MSLSGDIRDGHLRIGEWSAERQPGAGGVHPYCWGVKLSSGPLVRGVVVHDREDGTLGLVVKVLTAAVRQFGGRDHPDANGLAEDEIAYAIAGVYGESCGWGANRGRECGMCDCLGMTEAYARSAARAVLAIAAPRLAAAEVAAEGYRQRAQRAASTRDALIIMLARVRETAEHYEGRTGADAAAAILRVLDGAS